MNPSGKPLPLVFYRYLSATAYAVAMPVMRLIAFSGRAPGLWRGRLGIVPEQISAQSPWDIWIQAVSVGEAGVAKAIVDALDRIRPGLKIVISAFTETGIRRAEELLGSRCGIMPATIDFPQGVSRAVRSVRPRMFACIETELWPSMLGAMGDAGAVTVLLNGRISSRSFPRYRRIHSVTSCLLESFSLVCASSPASAGRLLELGARRDRLVLTGNAKYEALLERPDPSRVEVLRNLLGIRSGSPVIVAGSIRGGDESPLQRQESWHRQEKNFQADRR